MAMPTAAIDLVCTAEQILDGVIPMPAGRVARAAAAVARQALEDAVASATKNSRSVKT